MHLSILVSESQEYVVGSSSCIPCCISIQGPNDKDTKKKMKQRSDAGEEYELSRFKPALKYVLEVDFRFVLALFTDFY